MAKCFFYVINSQHYFFKSRFLLLDRHLILLCINSLRKEDIASQLYTERAIDCKAGYKHHLTKEYSRTSH